ncbi:NAD(+) synthase [Candidatus Caldatribacterium saccharofermentans]|uniref:NAD(+) synthase n=1 Tax=Candidatus Caldatribacterium saccharofermentans TaxID=1454753 RepID=UPI003D000049
MTPQEEVARIVQWMREKVLEARARGLVFGMSGGIDSSVVAVLAKKALGENVLGLVMPCYSDPADLEDAREVAEQFSIPYRIIPLEKPFDTLLEVLGEEKAAKSLPQANLKPRLRMCVLYFFANTLNYLVCGSSNRSELTVGYFTKYGDGGVDIAPLAHLTKRKVREIAAFLGIPEHIIAKPPSAGLWPGQTDEGEMGLTYEILDRFIEEGEVEEPYRSKILSMVRQSTHKRRLPSMLLSKEEFPFSGQEL